MKKKRPADQCSWPRGQWPTGTGRRGRENLLAAEITATLSRRAMQQHMSSAPCCFGSVKVGITDCKMQQQCDDAMLRRARAECTVSLIVQRPLMRLTDRECIFTFGPLSPASSDIRVWLCVVCPAQSCCINAHYLTDARQGGREGHQVASALCSPCPLPSVICPLTEQGGDKAEAEAEAATTTTRTTATWPWLAQRVGPVCSTVDGVSVITKCARLSISSSIMLAHQASSRPGGGASAGVRALHQPASCFIFDGDRRYVPGWGHGHG